MSEKVKIPSVESIMEEYKKQGKTLTVEEAKKVREEIQKDLESGHIDARGEIFLSDETVEKVAGGTGGCPIPTMHPIDDQGGQTGHISYHHR